MDWVSAHFPNDAHGLAGFDGTALYEHADPREGVHADGDTLIYNYGRNEVAACLIGSALEWVERFHVDGLRVDAVASMLYRDYSRAEGEWVPNEQGGRENPGGRFPAADEPDAAGALPGRAGDRRGIHRVAGVTAPVEEGGLGFTHKWNMGWMHDTLQYLGRDPVHRSHHHSQISFGLVYAFSERFVLPLSHDEVVHGKGRCWPRWRASRHSGWPSCARIASCGRTRAANCCSWAASSARAMSGRTMRHWTGHGGQRGPGPVAPGGRLNNVLRAEPALHRDERDERGFDWSVADDSRNSVYAFIRRDPAGSGRTLLVVSNFTPLRRDGYRVGVPQPGRWSERLNTDSAYYGGGNAGNLGAVHRAEADARPRAVAAAHAAAAVHALPAG